MNKIIEIIVGLLIFIAGLAILMKPQEISDFFKEQFTKVYGENVYKLAKTPTSMGFRIQFLGLGLLVLGSIFLLFGIFGN